MPPKSRQALWNVLQAEEPYQDEILRRLMAEDAIGSGQLIAMATSDRVLRLRVLRAIRDLGSS